MNTENLEVKNVTVVVQYTGGYSRTQTFDDELLAAIKLLADSILDKEDPMANLSTMSKVVEQLKHYHSKLLSDAKFENYSF